MPSPPERLTLALSKIDAAHAQDPNKTQPASGSASEVPYELHYAQRCTHFLEQVDPHASEVLQLAVRAQHFRRWEVPRSSYPMTKIGYHAWRTFLKKRQAELAKEICMNSGYTEDEGERVACLIRKEDLKADEETQVLEDVACLVFLDDQFAGFAEGVEEGKMVDILRKSWGKMSGRGRELALGIPMEGRAKDVLGKALGG